MNTAINQRVSTEEIQFKSTELNDILYDLLLELSNPNSEHYSPKLITKVNDKNNCNLVAFVNYKYNNLLVKIHRLILNNLSKSELRLLKHNSKKK